MQSGNIKVSVIITAYNVGKYLSQSLESVINQKTNFEYEILIGEDKSTDNTREIIQAFEARNIKNMRCFYNAQNMGYSANYVNLINSARGEYIAQIDGDDVVISPDKLQLLADTLDSKPDYAVCIHDYQIIDPEGKLLQESALGADYKHIEKDHFLYHTQPGDTAMWRRSFVPGPPLPEWMKDVGNPVDHAAFILASAKHPVAYLPLSLMAYRKHPTSITALAKKEYLLEKDIFMNQHFRAYYAAIDNSHDDIFRWGISYYQYRMAYLKFSQGKIFQFVWYFAKAFINWPTLSPKKHKDFLYLSSPETFNKIKSIFKRS